MTRLGCGAAVLALLVPSAGIAGSESPATRALIRLVFARQAASSVVVPGGLYGAYSNPRRVSVFEEAPCRFRLSEIGLDENGDHATDWVIDVNKVTAIDVDRVARPPVDPAATRIYRIQPARGMAIRVTFRAAVSPRAETFCHLKACGGTTFAALHRGDLDAAREAAAAFRKLCPGAQGGEGATPPAP